MINELGSRGPDVLRHVMNEMDSERYIIDANTQQTKTETLGGLFPNVKDTGPSEGIKFVLGKLTEHLMTRAQLEEAKRQGMVTMRQDGILKVLDGVTTLEEVLRETEE